MTERAVETTEMVAQNSASMDLSILGLIGQADIVVQLVMLSLLLASFWTWAIIFEKRKSYKLTQTRIKQFATTYRNQKDIVELSKKVSAKTTNPLTALFVTGMQTYSALAAQKHITKDDLKERLFHTMTQRKNQIIGQHEENLTFLATVGSASPFIGLFGTVWGIVNSFQAIAASKNATLAVVAPGIAEALLATAIGLLAAIPAVMFYNIFIGRLKLINIELEDYITEFLTAIIQDAGARKK